MIGAWGFGHASVHRRRGSGNRARRTLGGAPAARRGACSQIPLPPTAPAFSRALFLCRGPNGIDRTCAAALAQAVVLNAAGDGTRRSAQPCLPRGPRHPGEPVRCGRLTGQRRTVRAFRRAGGATSAAAGAVPANNAVASRRSAVAWPSVKRWRTPASSVRPSCARPRPCQCRARLIAARNSHASASCRRATSSARLEQHFGGIRRTRRAVPQQPFALCPEDFRLAPAGLAAVCPLDRRRNQVLDREGRKRIKLQRADQLRRIGGDPVALLQQGPERRHPAAPIAQRIAAGMGSRSSVIASAAASSPRQMAIGIAASTSV